MQRTFAHYTMSPRNKRLRKVINPPVVKGFKPYGSASGEDVHDVVSLFIEEYEALRLCDYEMNNHHEASLIMGVSRPTFTRIYAVARQKIARALVEGCQISIEGGKVYFDSDWYYCNHCNCYFNHPDKGIEIEICPLCQSREMRNIQPEEANIHGVAYRHQDVCVCPACGFEQVHEFGQPCGKQICPTCNSRMTRKKHRKTGTMISTKPVKN